MSLAALQSPEFELDFELIESDGEPLESERHVLQLTFLASLLKLAMERRGKADFYVGANMFVYYSVEQARTIATGAPLKTHFKGPDVFFVDGVPGHQRDYWVIWEEGGRTPDVIFELVSPTTVRQDRTSKKDFYEQTFRTPELFLYDPKTGDLDGYRLEEGRYREIEPDAHGHLWSEQLLLALGIWGGLHEHRDGPWLRCFEGDGRLVPTRDEAEHERAEAEHQRADAECQRADAAEAEIARLQERLAAPRPADD